MFTKWATYRQLLIEENGQIRLKRYEDIKEHLSSWLEYYQLFEIFKKDKQIGFDVEVSKLEKELLKNKVKIISKMYRLLLDYKVMDEEVKATMIRWAQDVGHAIMMKDWEYLYTVTLKLTASYNIRENILKWYIDGI